MKKIIVFTTAVLLLSSFVATETMWTEDKMHSQLNFSATHFFAVVGVLHQQRIYEILTIKYNHSYLHRRA